MTKKVFSVTIDEDILGNWKSYAEAKCVNSSKIIEKILKEYLEKENFYKGSLAEKNIEEKGNKEKSKEEIKKRGQRAQNL
jgi:predicted transcriptional regulator